MESIDISMLQRSKYCFINNNFPKSLGVEKGNKLRCPMFEDGVKIMKMPGETNSSLS